MAQTRRRFLTLAAGTSAITLLPLPTLASGPDVFQTKAGDIKIHPVTHASLVMETPKGNILVDPADAPSAYKKFPTPDLILITHHHGDHYKPNTIKALMGDKTRILANPKVYNQLHIRVEGKG